jgi:hypothetical protein
MSVHYNYKIAVSLIWQGLDPKIKIRVITKVSREGKTPSKNLIFAPFSNTAF